MTSASQDGAMRQLARFVSTRLSRDPELTLFAALAVAIRVAFWGLTGRTWEDALITVVHAQNALAGLGLVHHPGESPVHGFTSAMSVLIPLAGETLVAGAGLTAIRLASLIAVVVALIYARRITRRLAVSRWPSLLVLAYLAFDQNQVFYGMAGMETQVAVAVILAGAWYVLQEDPTRAGAALGLGLLARPDFLIWVGCALVGLWLASRTRAVVAAGVAAAIVAPWMVFTTLYYGSPIPQTIVAKALAFSGLPSGTDPGAVVAWLPSTLVAHISTVMRTFAPFYEDTLAVGAPLPAQLLFAVSVVVWSLVVFGAMATWGVKSWRPAIVFVGLYLIYRVTLLPPSYSDWYVPPFTALAIVLVAAGLDRIRLAPIPAIAASGALAVVFALNLPFTIGLAARVQADIETTVRQRVGEYLAANVLPSQAFLAESAGYFEFYSRRIEYDYPGLASRISLAALRSLPPEARTVAGLAASLQPPWLVLRPNEWQALREQYPAIAARYRVAADFRAPEVDGQISFAGFTLATIDEEFLILQTSP
jgi:hypothetical protein